MACARAFDELIDIGPLSEFSCTRVGEPVTLTGQEGSQPLPAGKVIRRCPRNCEWRALLQKPLGLWKGLGRGSEG